MNEKALRILFDMMSNGELLKLRKKEDFELDPQALAIFQEELLERELVEPDEVLTDWKKLQQPKEETWIVTFFYAPLQRPAIGIPNNWGMGTTRLKAKSAADAYARYPDSIKQRPAAAGRRRKRHMEGTVAAVRAFDFQHRR